MRRGELIFNLVFYSGLHVIVLGIVAPTVVMFLTNAPLGYELIMFLCWAIGFGLFLKSKISVYRQGRLLSFGPLGMTRSNQLCYRFGYLLMAIALFLSLILYIFYRASN
jgi:hypothetical protein